MSSPTFTTLFDTVDTVDIILAPVFYRLIAAICYHVWLKSFAKKAKDDYFAAVAEHNRIIEEMQIGEISVRATSEYVRKVERYCLGDETTGAVEIYGQSLYDRVRNGENLKRELGAESGRALRHVKACEESVRLVAELQRAEREFYGRFW